MPIPSELSKKIRMDFYRMCTGVELSDYSEMPWRFRHALEIMDERAMRVACIRHHLANKAARSCTTIAIRYGVTNEAVRRLRVRRADES